MRPQFILIGTRRTADRWRRLNGVPPTEVYYVENPGQLLGFDARDMPEVVMLSDAHELPDIGRIRLRLNTIGVSPSEFPSDGFDGFEGSP